MPEELFSDREGGARPRTELEIGDAAWGGIVALVRGGVTAGAYGIDFPDECADQQGIIGTDTYAFSLATKAEIPEVGWPFSLGAPPTLAILDFVEFCHEHVAAPTSVRYHDYLQHHHLVFDREQGQTDFRMAVNRIFARNHLSYELDDDGEVQRLAAPVLNETLDMAVFRTGDVVLDGILETARTKFFDPDPGVRREAIEKLWDAWERLKSLEPGLNKRASITALLDRAGAEPVFRAALEQEAKALTDIGNQFHIRHSETNQTRLQRDDQVDYLFHRLFALIWLVLRTK